MKAKSKEKNINHLEGLVQNLANLSLSTGFYNVGEFKKKKIPA